MINRDCLRCYFRVPNNVLNPRSGAACREGSATAILIPSPATGKPVIVSAFPTVEPGQWCYRFIEKTVGEALEAQGIHPSAMHLYVRLLPDGQEPDLTGLKPNGNAAPN